MTKNQALAAMNFQIDGQQHTAHLERDPGTRHYVVKVDGQALWTRSAGLLGFRGQFPVLGCRCHVQGITLGGLLTRYRLSLQCPNRPTIAGS